MIRPSVLIGWYRRGLFPMAHSATGEIQLFSPDPRAVLDLNGFHLPRSLRRTIASGIFSVKINEAFEDVIRGCADRSDTWLSEMLIDSYIGLHRAGWAHSVETWAGGQLAGGLYGVAIAGAFFGESMYSRRPDASKVALVRLVERMRVRNMALLDAQFVTPHLARFGVGLIPRSEYLVRLDAALRSPASFV